MARTVARLVYNRFPEIARRLPVETGRIVEETAFAIEALAKIHAPVDTGALRASIQTEAESNTERVVYTNVEYAGYVEYGTSKMGAQPYMTPAAEAERPRFVAKMQRLEERLR